MNEYFVDTNVFLRYLTADIPEQAAVVERLVQRAQAGSVALTTSLMVVAEIIWTLESYYELPRSEIRDKVLAILNTAGLSVEHPALVAQAVTAYAELNVDFIDAFNALWMAEHGLERVVTLDTKHFSRLPGVSAITPDKAR
jgi:predicted nucleic-acid-binding protein